MDLELSGRVAMVTGASRGIGYAVAERLAAEGAAVAICARDAEAVTTAAERLRASGGTVFAAAADTSLADDRARFAAEARAALGPVDILVNNAGTHVRGTVDDMRDEDLQRQLADKVFGFLGMIRAVLPDMRARGDGRIVNVIGQAVRHPHPDRLPSGIANAAAQAMTKAVADAVARDNVRVNSVCPQYIDTGIVADTIAREMARRRVDRETAMAGFTRANVLGRLGRVEEVADLVAFLASARADFVAGSSVSVDGGYHRYVFG